MNRARSQLLTCQQEGATLDPVAQVTRKPTPIRPERNEQSQPRVQGEEADHSGVNVVAFRSMV